MIKYSCHHLATDRMAFSHILDVFILVNWIHVKFSIHGKMQLIFKLQRAFWYLEMCWNGEMMNFQTFDCFILLKLYRFLVMIVMIIYMPRVALRQSTTIWQQRVTFSIIWVQGFWCPWEGPYTRGKADFKLWRGF